MIKNCLVLILFMLAEVALAATNLTVIVDSSKVYKPKDGDVVQLKIRSNEAGSLRVEILSEDGMHIRQLHRNIQIKANGLLTVEWDGTDDDGRVVPSEVYFPKVTFSSQKNGKDYEYNPLAESGGSMLRNIPVSLDKYDNFSLKLSSPSRLLIRGGVHDGPLLKTFSSWRPYPQGIARFNWDGMVSGQDIYVAGWDKFRLVATGYRLPRNAIILQAESNYWEYCKKKSRTIDGELLNKKHQRIVSDRRISARFLDSKCIPIEPKISLGVVRDGEKIIVRIDVPEMYSKAIAQDFYEVVFFLDNEFVSEREQGYMPMEWVYSLGKSKPKILTVNLTGYKKQIATASILIPTDE